MAGTREQIIQRMNERALKNGLKFGTINLEELTIRINAALIKAGHQRISSTTIRQKLNAIIRQQAVSKPEVEKIKIQAGKEVKGKSHKQPTTAYILGITSRPQQPLGKPQLNRPAFRKSPLK